MGAVRVERVSRIPRLSPFLMMVVGFVALIVLGFELFATQLFTAPPETLCPLRASTGLPCPGCGGTRSAKSMLAFDFMGALAHNPLLASGALVLFAALAIRLVFGRTLVCSPTQRQWTLIGIGFGLLILLNWIWVLGRHEVLPLGNAPAAGSTLSTVADSTLTQ